MVVLIEYSHYNNDYLAKNTADFPELIRINNYIIKLEKNKQLHFDPIYSLELV